MSCKKTFILFLLIWATFGLKAQTVGIKTNLLYDATLSPNLGVEFKMAPKWTFDISGNINAWNINEHRWRHWLAQPEARLWICEAFQGSFFGLHALGGQYNVGNIKNNIKFLGSDFSQLSDFRYQGWYVGAGIAYGYAWMLGKHWNLEAEIGIGYIYTRFDKFPCTECGTKIEHDKPHNYYGPTKLNLAIEYLF
ncbi:MAG: DUF3575 domain-containing protein [Muribaculaceae bacterium]|nr:DUF3575 domain-containing protein [Muribaculaceae bacterium]